MKFKSPAKINLFLKVLSKREDGFHNLVTLMQAVDLCDQLDIQITEKNKDTLTCTQSDLSCQKDNLVIKAIDLYRKKTGIKQHFTVHLEKNIPIQAGLGGGSSNAATALFGINKLLGNKANDQELIEWSKELGSDITFFLSNGTALCTRRGEEVENLGPLGLEKDIFIIKPKDIFLSTPKVFQHFSPRFLEEKNLEEKSFYLNKNLWCENELLLAAEELEPQLKKLKNKLSQTFEKVGLSGTGPSFFAWGCQTEPEIENVHIYKVKCMQKSPDGWF
jgi:4-diphosphocytidyl-2-C-methyl-D-erythritol kinase